MTAQMIAVEPRSKVTTSSRQIKHGLDRVTAALLLLVLAPVLLVLAACVRCTSPGPSFYRQERIGHGGRPFRIVKFRTMRPGADALLPALLAAHDREGAPLFKVPEDPRVTGFGRVLRRTSLDELPQLWNIVCGHMSFVGPRPQRAEEVALYEPHHHRRLTVRPGLTGLWQVSGRSDVGWDEAVDFDLEYIDSWTLGLDALILVRTVPAVLRSRGAS